MNVEELINAAGVAIEKQIDHTHAHYWLIIRAGTLYCVPQEDKRPMDIPIYLLTQSQMRHGLNPIEWAAIGVNLFKVYGSIKL